MFASFSYLDMEAGGNQSGIVHCVLLDANSPRFRSPWVPGLLQSPSALFRPTHDKRVRAQAAKKIPLPVRWLELGRWRYYDATRFLHPVCDISVMTVLGLSLAGNRSLHVLFFSRGMQSSGGEFWASESGPRSWKRFIVTVIELEEDSVSCVCLGRTFS